MLCIYIYIYIYTHTHTDIHIHIHGCMHALDKYYAHTHTEKQKGQGSRQRRGLTYSCQSCPADVPERGLELILRGDRHPSQVSQSFPRIVTCVHRSNVSILSASPSHVAQKPCKSPQMSVEILRCPLNVTSEAHSKKLGLLAHQGVFCARLSLSSKTTACE
jgi:hypothetical protein